MERFYNCKNCMKTFKVSSVTEPSAQIPETKVSVTCPVCNTPNTVTLLGSQIYCCPAKVAHYSLLPRLDSTSRLSGSLIILRRKARIFGLASLQPGAAIGFPCCLGPPMMINKVVSSPAMQHFRITFGLPTIRKQQTRLTPNAVRSG